MASPIKSGCGCLVLLVAMAAIGVYSISIIANSNPPLPDVATIDKSPEKQEARHQLLEKLIKRGVFTKIEQPADLPHAYVGPAFYTLTIDDKQSFVSVVYAYYFDGSDPVEHVRIFDGYSGKQIGDFDKTGLSLY